MGRRCAGVEVRKVRDDLDPAGASLDLGQRRPEQIVLVDRFVQRREVVVGRGEEPSGCLHAGQSPVVLEVQGDAAGRTDIADEEDPGCAPLPQLVHHLVPLLCGEVLANRGVGVGIHEPGQQERAWQRLGIGHRHVAQQTMRIDPPRALTAERQFFTVEPPCRHLISR